MTKAEALQAAREGKKVTHRYFLEDEWFYIGSDGQVVYEDSVETDLDEFLKWHSEEGWDDGYSLWIPPGYSPIPYDNISALND